MNVSTGEIWCYACDAEVVEPDRAPHEYKVCVCIWWYAIHMIFILAEGVSYFWAGG